MNSNSLKFTFKLIFAAFALVLVLSSCGDAPEKEMTSPIQPPPPLSAQELALVVGEINAMIKTDESLIDNFVVQEATPERIEKLFALPEQASYKIRNNALILAGQGSLLSFNKPSDIINKLNAWFPDGVRSNPQGNLKNTGLKLYGPYSGWSDEATAFIMMWRCMPPEIIPLGSTQSSIESRQKFILEQVNFLTKESYSYNGRLQPKTYWDPVRHN
ncbi:MAG: hypothetical protein HOO97_03095, partial [Sideroxydans sp.]|nr:hypothetical protein [Sideroxydans sp.]